MASSFRIVPAFERPLSEQAEAFSQAFSDYIAGPAKLDTEGISRYFFGQAVDLWLSRLVMHKERIVAFGYINRTGEISRLAGMGVVPEARRHGAGRQLMEQLILESRQRHDRLMTLEVFEQNVPALELYRRFGFREVSRLFGWETSASPAGGGAHLEEITVLELIRRASRFEYPAVPWQVSVHAALKLAPGSRVLGLGKSLVALMNTEREPVFRMVHQGPDAAPEPDWAELRQLVAGCFALFPGRQRWSFPPIVPEQIGQNLFGPLGFSRQKLNQFQMELTLTPGQTAGKH
jgi:ribosomal protein S18 acetylase RimI-like enzyme